MIITALFSLCPVTSVKDFGVLEFSGIKHRNIYCIECWLYYSRAIIAIHLDDLMVRLHYLLYPCVNTDRAILHRYQKIISTRVSVPTDVWGVVQRIPEHYCYRKNTCEYDLWIIPYKFSWKPHMQVIKHARYGPEVQHRYQWPYKKG